MDYARLHPKWHDLAAKIEATQMKLDYLDKRDELIAELEKRPELRAKLRRKAGLPPLPR